MSESPESRLKRLRMRSWRRGMREMDLLLGPFSDGPLTALSPESLAIYEELLSENDQDLYLWLVRKKGLPSRYEGIARAIVEYQRPN